MPATELPSVSVFDYWSPSTAVQRLLCGAAVDQMEIVINGDYHEFHFSGLAQDVVDSSSFLGGRRAASELSAGAGTAVRSTIRLCRETWGRRGWEHRPAQFFTITERVGGGEEQPGHADEGIRIEPSARDFARTARL